MTNYFTSQAAPGSDLNPGGMHALDSVARGTLENASHGPDLYYRQARLATGGDAIVVGHDALQHAAGASCYAHLRDIYRLTLVA